MSLAFALLTVGGILIYSGLKGLSITEVLNGATGNVLDPKGGTIPASSVDRPGNGAADYDKPTEGGVGGGTVVSPIGGHRDHVHTAANEPLLSVLKAAAIAMGLRITSTTGGSHTAGSYHYAGKAFDASGSPEAMMKYNKWVANNHGDKVIELFYDPGVSINND